jgi:chemotaxis protein methyltransferase CheR
MMMPGTPDLSDREFEAFQAFIHRAAGIALPHSKKVLVTSRLSRRLTQLQLPAYSDYYDLVIGGQDPVETQHAIDLLTTNETYFFREPKHFDLLRRVALQSRGRADSFRAWSAASSSGEEAYSIAMVLADVLAALPWEVVGTDISHRVLEKAEAAVYPLERTDGIPPVFLKRYCLRGHGEYEGTLLVQRKLRERVQFQAANLNEGLPQLGRFDVIFLRNVLIYFDPETKRSVVRRCASLLKPDGLLLIGHSESLQGLDTGLRMVAPSIYGLPRDRQ